MPAFSNNSKSLNAGFTLIELSISLIVTGIILSSLIPIYNMFLIQKKEEKLQESMKKIRMALYDYVSEAELPDGSAGEYRYPCPAPVDAAFSSSEFGVEKCSGSGIQSAIIDGNVVLIGSVPTRTLGLASEESVDAWHNKYTYAVSENLIAPDSMKDIRVPGNIEVVEAGSTITKNAQFVLVSHGKDGGGSYSMEGAANGQACRAGLEGDGENCNGDGVFRTSQGEYNAENNLYYDDRISFALGDLKGSDSYGGQYTMNIDGTCRWLNPYTTACNCMPGYYPIQHHEFHGGRPYYCDDDTRIICGIDSFICLRQ